MKKLLCAILLLFLSALLAGCGDESGGQQPPDNLPTDAISATPTPTYAPSPTPTPEPTPFPWVSPSDYVMIWKNDTKRGISYKVPVHWQLHQSGDRFLIYYEPTPEGENGFRLFLANKKMSTEPNSNAMRKELSDILKSMEEDYTDFKSDGNVSRDFQLVRFTGFSTYYTYTDNYGVSMKGFVIIATYNRRIYCMNFSGPEARFKDMQSIGASIMESVTRVT